MQNLIVTGGINHPFEASAESLARVLSDVGISSQITLDVDSGMRDVAAGKYSLVTLYALRWRMLDHDKYAPFRDRWAFVLNDAGQQALRGHVARGGGLLGLHTAALCFDAWPGWRDLLGATWRWGASFCEKTRNILSKRTPLMRSD